MGPSDDPEIGGHSWTPIEANCIECHQAVPGEADGFTQDMATLLALLQQVEGVDPDTGDPIIGIMQPGSDSDANEGVFPDVAAMAAWNYRSAQQDHSRGIHNPEDTKALLKNSIEAVEELLNNQ
jgi:hypothetical protein